METFPIVLDTYFTEREGVLKIEVEINKLGLIFRETPNADVGIDGQIEYVNNNDQAIGRIMAAQIKSGDSYLIDKGEHWAFYPKPKHKSYWESYPIPVLLLVFSPSKKVTYYTDVRYQLNIPGRTNDYISIPKSVTLESSTKDILFQNSGEIGTDFFEPPKLFETMVKTKCNNPTFNLSFFDLFVQGLTNLSRQIFFSMQMAIEIAEYNNDSEFGLSLGMEENEFLHDYVKFLVSQNLARVDYADFLIDWKERQLQPTFLSTLTTRGRKLLSYISEQETKHKDSLPPTRLTSERLLNIGTPFLETNRFKKAKMLSKLYV
jgi:hypothetical protein